jgi:hypothetical protein
MLHQSKYYPAAWQGKVPVRIRMKMTVMNDHFCGYSVGEKEMLAVENCEYRCWVNSHGAVSAITPDGLLGVKPAEFEVTEWVYPENCQRLTVR